MKENIHVMKLEIKNQCKFKHMKVSRLNFKPIEITGEDFINKGKVQKLNFCFCNYSQIDNKKI